MALTRKEFLKLSSLVYKQSGINLHEGKKHLLEARLGKRLRATGISSVRQYLKLIEQDKTELTHFLDAVSTNHTYFFRESRHFECLRPEHVSIWCAACSSGEEPYSVAIDCLEKGFRPAILATDISTKVLKEAQEGIYPIEKAKEVPLNLMKKYFKRGVGKWEGYIKIKQEVREMVTFKRFNLLKGHPPREKFHVIFCRNVLIYFDRSAKERVVNNLYQALKPDGYLIIGGAETLSGINHPYKYIKPSIYQKPSGRY
ncbi:MAG: protein-glutamate O-methyltransferase CheR [Deltaproteobacteria bacterium]|nr:protein-glutamate O-methyltransferase CheR [Deltaproteobacteria bacterium]MBW1930321.1 protein-glutamate O-methyltransferase CheR [Deltaproteobacteria bacterium]MBW2025287.1 protein-glutamate O-methyltransferase CheR [Deltaproteobacteria bacterium]MBW2125274.1 protein-glutamate O-methyltransferase CheR [Deltaproteobacteria bacterium]RLB18478.1 MAG: chemotaxis protein CheR [Deltaproteobacteria bacterium]